MSKKSMLWMGPAFIGAFAGIIVALVIVAMLAIPFDSHPESANDTHDSTDTQQTTDADHSSEAGSDNGETTPNGDHSDTETTEGQEAPATTRPLG